MGKSLSSSVHLARLSREVRCCLRRKMRARRWQRKSPSLKRDRRRGLLPPRSQQESRPWSRNCNTRRTHSKHKSLNTRRLFRSRRRRSNSLLSSCPQPRAEPAPLTPRRLSRQLYRVGAEAPASPRSLARVRQGSHPLSGRVMK